MRSLLPRTNLIDGRLWISVWGGPREVAQAIWKVKNTRSEAELKAFIGKLRVFFIACQDASHEWLMTEFPDLFIIESRKTYQGMFGSDSRAWAEENIIKNHGPLGAIYPPKAVAGPGVIEGDTPAFLYLVSANRGLNDPEDPTQPSWGGQYKRKPNTNHYVDGPGHRASPNGARTIRKNFRNEPTGCCRESERGFCLKGNNMRHNADQTSDSSHSGLHCSAVRTGGNACLCRRRPGPATREAVCGRVANPSPGDAPNNWWIVGNFVAGSAKVTADNWLGGQPSGERAAGDYRVQ